MTSSVDGLISGLSTTDLINQLMKVEAAPQQALKTKLTAEQKVITTYQAVNAKMLAVQSAAQTLTGTAPWTAMRVTSSSPAVTATADSTAAAGSTTFDVVRMASTHVVTLGADGTGSVLTGSALRFYEGGSLNPIIVSLAGHPNTLQGLADAVNATAGLGVRAAVITTDAGELLQLRATTSGSAAAFTVDSADTVAAARTVVPGLDGQIAIGDPADGGYYASSATNTYTNVIPGVAFTANQVQQGVTLSTASDSGGLADAMQALVDSVNSALGSITSQSGYDAGTKTGGTLLGDFATGQLQQRLVSAVSSGTSGYSFGKLGVQLTRDGQLTFNRSTFLAAYQADPAGVQTAVASGPAAGQPAGPAGLARLMQNIATSATDATTGSLTMAIQGGNDLSRTLNDNIADWDVRLQLRRDDLQRQFSAMEVALGKLKDQSTWLSGQIASLPSKSG
jgi:flagellar hook-associated protein 2